VIAGASAARQDPASGETRCSNSPEDGLAGAKSAFSRPSDLELQQRFDAGLRYATRLSSELVRCDFGHLDIRTSGKATEPTHCHQKGKVGHEVSAYACHCISQTQADELVRQSAHLFAPIALGLAVPVAIFAFLLNQPALAAELVPDWRRADLLLRCRASRGASVMWLVLVAYEGYLAIYGLLELQTALHPSYYSGCGHTSWINAASEYHWLFWLCGLLFWPLCGCALVGGLMALTRDTQRAGATAGSRARMRADEGTEQLV
jgi:hypothetical protein